MFTELKCKTCFSFLRGASQASQYIQQAHALGYTALAITDVNGVYALPRAYEAIKELKKDGFDFKLICGSEVTLLEHPPVTLLAKTRKAYGVMCRLLTELHAGKEKGKGLLKFSELIEILDRFGGGEDLVCIADFNEHTNVGLLKEIFNENLFLPLTRYLDGLDDERTAAVRTAAEKHHVQIVATNDVHYHDTSHRPLQDAMTCIREGTNIDDAGFLLFGNDERYLKSPLQMRALYSDLPEAITNAQKIADSCSFHLSELKYSYPHEFIPEGHTAKSYLAEVVYQGALKTYKGLIPAKAAAQIKRELDFFEKRGDEHYFLTVYDIVNFASENDIICQGRGSAANSIVCYVLGITSVDPIQMNLLFDRFMNDGRTEPPDIDVDFEHERREEVIQYIYRRFGRDRAAMVAAVRTYRSRSCFLELSKAVGINTGTISAGELETRFDEIAGEKKVRRPLIDLMTAQMKRFPRHLSIHSGGFVLSNDPLIEMVPVEPARKENRTIIQWDKDDLETLGLMKVDVLSIGFLTALHRACNYANMNWRDIPPYCEKTYKMIQLGQTIGTFQIESRAQISMLTQTLPQNYYDLVVQVALVRPSPTVGGMVRPYIEGLFKKRRGIVFDKGNTALNTILQRTHGVPIFQEQIMQISIEVAGFTPAEADQLRRSLGLQRAAENVNVMGERLRLALLKEGIPQDFAAALFEYIKGYSHYGFPESHAASYASLAYKSAYMRCHYPAELVAALINSMPMGFYSVDVLIGDAKRNGVKFLPLHPNKSEWECTIEAPQTVRMGFGSVRKVREDDVKELVRVRNERAFDSVEDFVFRTRFPKDVLENLALADVFACFGLDRRHSFWQSLQFTTLTEKNSPAQGSLFNEKTKLSATLDLFSAMNLRENIITDQSKLGYSLHGNIMQALRKEIRLPALTSADLKKLPAQKQVSYAGILSVFQRPPPAKGTAFITLEDEFGSVDSVIKKEVYEKYEDVIRSSRYLIFTGHIQKRGTGTSLIVSEVQSFARKESNKPYGPQQNLGRLTW